MTIENDPEIIAQERAYQEDIDRVNALLEEERRAIEKQDALCEADIERINRTCMSFQLTVPPKISENLAWMPELQPPITNDQ